MVQERNVGREGEGLGGACTQAFIISAKVEVSQSFWSSTKGDSKESGTNNGGTPLTDLSPTRYAPSL